MTQLLDRYDLGQAVEKQAWLEEHRDELYVFIHLDRNGVPFYAGRGRNGRAWSRQFGLAWEWFVTHRMDNTVPVLMLGTALDDSESAALLEEVLARHGPQLLVQANQHRGMNYEALQRYRSAKDKVGPYYDWVRYEKDEDHRLQLALVAQELMYEVDSSKNEQGRFGEVIRAMGAAPSDVYPFFIKYIVEGLLLQGRVEEARSAWAKYRAHDSVSKLDAIERMVERGTFRRRGRRSPE